MNYKRLGNYIELIDVRNTDLSVDKLLGLTIDKKFIPSVANTIGTNMKRYKIIRRNQFACSTMQVRRDGKMPIAILKDYDEAIISQAYPVFKVIDEQILNPDYLMMWFTRQEFDRQATFHAVGGVRGSIEWVDFLDFELPIPSIEKQREIVAEYQAVENKIKTNEAICEKLEETALTIYRRWFVNNGEKTEARLEDYVEVNPKVKLKKGDRASYVGMADVSENSMTIQGYIKRKFKGGGARFLNNDTLLARITPCLENGKTAFVNFLKEDEVAWGSTEFIVLRARGNSNPYWTYCLARNEDFRNYAISSMVGSSGRQRVQSDYLNEYKLPNYNPKVIERFEVKAKPIFKSIKHINQENQKLHQLQALLLGSMTREEEKRIKI